MTGTVTPDKGSGGFDGEHQDGDILFTSAMTNGGSASVVNIFRWKDDPAVEGDAGLVSGREPRRCRVRGS